MRIRLKLLILLLVIALVPLVTVTWYDLRATRDLGLELSRRAREVLHDRAEKQLLVSVQDSAQLLLRERKLLETAVKLQAQAIEELLRKTPLPRGKAAPAALDRSDGTIAVTVDGPAAAQGDAWRTRLSGLVPVLEGLRREYSPNALWQRLVLEAGVRAVYPAAHVEGGEPEPWYQRARELRDLVVMPPHLGRWTGMPVLTVAAPILGANREFLGATAIDAPLAAVLGDVAAEPTKPARLLIGDPGEVGGRQVLRVAAERGDGGITARNTVYTPDAAPGLATVLADMAAGRAGVRRVEFEGQVTLWAYAPIDDDKTHLMFVVPFDEIIADAMAAQAYVFERLTVQRGVLWLSLIVFVPVLVGLSVFASQAVTRPVKQLAEAARQLASGNFHARTRIKSGDELEELGRLFNVMVPQLDASMRMRDSLALAQEVQQNLLPREAPRVPGFDIAGRSIYCDETGGDYYDFIEVPSLGPGAIAVTIGDVAGHGIAAALMMTTTRALLRSREPEPGRMPELVEAVNRQLCRDTHAGRFVTLFIAVLDSERRRVNWVVAGHEPGFIYDPQADSFLEIAGPDIPLGIDPDWRFQEQSHEGWPEGTVLLLGTDGIWETRGARGEMFGKDTVRAIIRENAGRPAAEIADAIVRALAHFRHGRPQLDDVTLVVVKAGGDASFIADAKGV